LENHRPKLAIFFDAENVSLKYAPKVLQQLSALWDAHLRRAYGRSLASEETILRESSIVPVEVLHNAKAKNSADLALAIDAMEELCLGASEAICIVTADSDFTRLLQRIREKGKTAIAFGNAKTPVALRKACTEFHLVEAPKPAAPNTPKQGKTAKTANPTASNAPKNANNGNAVKAATPNPPKKGKNSMAAKPNTAIRQPLTPALAAQLKVELRRAFREYTAAGNDTLAGFGGFLSRKYPAFSSRKYGFSGIRRMLVEVGGLALLPVLNSEGRVIDYRISSLSDRPADLAANTGNTRVEASHQIA
jgi:uncharacterized LabA/DUF88 family protein